MNKLKMFFGKIWKGIKRIGFAIKYGFSRLIGLLIKARRGEALEIHPKVTRAFQIGFKIFLGLCVLLFCFEVAIGVGIYKYRSDDAVTKFVARYVPYPAAVVQGRIVTMDNYYRNLTYISCFYSSTGQTDIDLADIKDKILDQLIENELLTTQMKKYDVSVKKTDVNSAYAQVVSENNGEEEVQKILRDLYCLNVRDFKMLISDQLVQQKLLDVVPVQVRAQHILIRVDSGATQETVDAAKAKIDGIATEINNGLDFGEAAKKYSEDTGSNTAGGELDWFARGDMVAAFEDAAFKTEVGKVSEPVRTDYGWHLIKVEEKKGTVDMSFTDWVESLKENSMILKIYRPN